jgi:hypothetical protein
MDFSMFTLSFGFGNNQKPAMLPGQFSRRIPLVRLALPAANAIATYETGLNLSQARSHEPR